MIVNWRELIHTFEVTCMDNCKNIKEIDITNIKEYECYITADIFIVYNNDDVVQAIECKYDKEQLLELF